MIIPKQIQSKLNLRILKHKEKTGHTKFTVLGVNSKRKKHQLNWQVIKCKECEEVIQ